MPATMRRRGLNSRLGAQQHVTGADCRFAKGRPVQTARAGGIGVEQALLPAIRTQPRVAVLPWARAGGIGVAQALLPVAY
ncbi:MAG: hypothetical protein ACRD3O_15865, partial [Terriglobia bacterium]